MKAKNLTLEKKLFEALSNGTEVLELNLLKQKDSNKRFDILLNESILLRVERKKTRKIDKEILNWAKTGKNLASSRPQRTLKEIISLDKQIKDKINRNLTHPGGSKEGFIDVYSSLERRWNKIKILEKELGVRLIKKDRIGFCDRCNDFRQASGMVKFQVVACQFCNRPIKKTKTYFSIPDAVSQYINGFWFEHYISKKLMDLGWITFTDVYVYGSSGVKFEIDILAAKGTKTLLVECKSGGSGLGDLSNLIAKYNEIRTSSAAFISVPKLNSDVHKMGLMAGGLTIIDRVKGDRGLISKLKKL